MSHARTGALRAPAARPRTIAAMAVALAALGAAPLAGAQALQHDGGRRGLQPALVDVLARRQLRRATGPLPSRSARWATSPCSGIRSGPARARPVVFRNGTWLFDLDRDGEADVTIAFGAPGRHPADGGHGRRRQGRPRRLEEQRPVAGQHALRRHARSPPTSSGARAATSRCSATSTATATSTSSSTTGGRGTPRSIAGRPRSAPTRTAPAARRRLSCSTTTATASTTSR